jgi:hypothetical protein
MTACDHDPVGVDFDQVGPVVLHGGRAPGAAAAGRRRTGSARGIPRAGSVLGTVGLSTHLRCSGVPSGCSRCAQRTPWQCSHSGLRRGR